MKTIIDECIECRCKDFEIKEKEHIFQRDNPGIVKITNECIECKNCGETYFDEKQSEELAKKIDEKIKNEF